MAYLTPEQQAKLTETQQNGDINPDKNNSAPALATLEPKKIDGIGYEGIDAGDVKTSAPEVSAPAVAPTPVPAPAKAKSVWGNLNDMYDDLVKSSDKSEKDREAALGRQQKAHDLTQAVRVGLGAFGNAMGGYTAKMEPDTYTPLTRKLVERLRDQRDISDRQLKLAKLRSAVRQSLQDKKLSYQSEKDKQEAIREDEKTKRDIYYHSPKYLATKQKIITDGDIEASNAKSEQQKKVIAERTAQKLKEIKLQGEYAGKTASIRNTEKLKTSKINGDDYTPEQITSLAVNGYNEAMKDRSSLPKSIKAIIDKYSDKFLGKGGKFGTFEENALAKYYLDNQVLPTQPKGNEPIGYEQLTHPKQGNKSNGTFW